MAEAKRTRNMGRLTVFHNTDGVLEEVTDIPAFATMNEVNQFAKKLDQGKYTVARVVSTFDVEIETRQVVKIASNPSL